MSAPEPALPSPPPWLLPLQEAFGDMLRSRLDSSGGTLRSRAERYPPELVAQMADVPTTRAGLALYHEQYWMRLFTAMQGELPRFAQVVGYWRFNALAARHLTEAPPTQPDLARCADGFAARLLDVLDGLVASVRPASGPPDTRPVHTLVCSAADNPWVATLGDLPAPVDLARQALRMDEAARHAFVSPFEGIWHPSPSELAQLEARRLRFAGSFRLLREDWSLADRAAPPAGRPELFERHDRPRYWVSFRAERTTALRRIEPPFARFLALAARSAFGEALSATEQAFGPTHAQRLHAAMPDWIHLALASGWWVGTREPRSR